MVCYKCGCRLSEHDFCTACGADVALYKRILSASNRLYNDGLEKASVRDLSGAIVSLRQSLKFNKNNIDARNLLGLVYFEIGEAVAALKEWVISDNIRPKKNIAADYIEMIQANQTRLSSINETIKKYNQALMYCNQDSIDLAVIQLKKVLSNSPKYVRAHQLLALLNINSEEWEKAQRELIKCSHVDTNNTTTLRYQKEVERMLMPETAPGNKPGSKKKASGNSVRYQSGNEIIIQPANVKETKGIGSLLNLGIGVIIGVAIACFLILPGQIQSAKADIDEKLRVVSENSDAKTATIDELEQKVQKLQDENTRLSEEVASYQVNDDTLKATDNLMMAVSAYLSNPDDLDAVADHLEALDEELQKEDGESGQYKTESYMALYNGFVDTVRPRLVEYYYNTGYENYRGRNFEDAIPDLARAYQYDETNVNALFFLGISYYRTEDYDNAKETFAKVIDNFPGTNSASQSETYLAEINNMEQ